MSNVSQYIVFKVSDEQYAIHIHNVQEIIRLTSICETPNSTRDYLKGVINLRGNVIPVISLSQRFSKKEKKHSKSTRIIITEIDDLHVGMIVDEILKVEFLELQPLPESANEHLKENCAGISYMGDFIIPIVKISSVLEIGRD